MTGQPNKSGGPRKNAGRPYRVMKTTIAQTITPDDNTRVIVSDAGLISVNDSAGNPFVPCARSDDERANATQRLWVMLQNKDEITNMPARQLIDVALFGGSPLRGLKWELHHQHPPPANAQYICWIEE